MSEPVADQSPARAMIPSLAKSVRTDVTTLVTGASSGIGRELARLAAPESRVLVLVARRMDRLEELAEELREEHAGLEVKCYRCDLADSDSVWDMIGLLHSDGVEVDHFVCNAGFGDAGDFDAQDVIRQRNIVAVNALSAVTLLNAFLPGMRERNYGRVLIVASTAAFQPVPKFAVYSATKAFLHSLAMALWAEYRETDIGISCLCPGQTRTEFFEVNRGFAGTLFMKFRMADPKWVAARGYRGMQAGKRLVVPGFVNKVATKAAAFIPKDLLLWIGKRLFTTEE